MQKVNVAVKNGKQKTYGFAKWSIFSVLILTYILVYFHRMAPGVVSEYLMGAFQTTGAELGALSAIYFFVYAFMQVPSGVIADTLGTRMSVINGTSAPGTGSIVFGLSESFAMACLGRFLVGLGVSVVFVAIMKSNSVWFHERVFALMSGVTLLVGNLGSVMAAGPLAALLTTFAWRNVFIGIGAFSLLLAVLGYKLVENKPEDMGFDPPNNYRVEKSNLTSTSWFTNLISVVSAWRVWPGFWVQFGMIGSLYSFMGLWGIRYLQDVHTIDRTLAARHMTVMLLCFAAGALFFGWLSDRIGMRKPIITGCVLGYLASWLILINVSWSPGAEGYVLFGFMGLMGAGFVVTFAAAKEVIHPHLSGMAVSVVNTGCFIGTAIMQPLFGYIVDRSWDGHVVGGVRLYSAGDYNHSFLLVLVFAVIAVIGAFKLQETNCKNIMAENCR